MLEICYSLLFSCLIFHFWQHFLQIFHLHLFEDNFFKNWHGGTAAIVEVDGIAVMIIIGVDEVVVFSTTIGVGDGCTVRWYKTIWENMLIISVVSPLFKVDTASWLYPLFIICNSILQGFWQKEFPKDDGWFWRWRKLKRVPIAQYLPTIQLKIMAQFMLDMVRCCVFHDRKRKNEK